MLYNPYDAAGAQFDLHEYLFVWMTLNAQQSANFVQEGQYVPSSTPPRASTSTICVHLANGPGCATARTLHLHRPSTRARVWFYSTLVGMLRVVVSEPDYCASSATSVCVRVCVCAALCYRVKVPRRWRRLPTLNAASGC